jgi:flagellin-like protein
MRPFRRDRRGLAEIVGTLMLVVIVVAAATAFSFFVAAYQKQLQAEETANHNRALEDVKIISVSEVPCSGVTCNDTHASNESFAELSFLVASLDVNSIGITGLLLNGRGVVNYTATFANGTSIDPCYDKSAHIPGNLTSGLVSCLPLSVPPYSSVRLVFNLDKNGSGAFAFGGTYDLILPTTDVTLQVLTQLTNVFTETFAPPDAIISVFFVSSGSSSIPVFDGLNSYQPVSANNVSIVWYNWTIWSSPPSPLPLVSFSGPEFEHDLAPGNYTVTLNVTNTDGLTGATTLSYTQP